MILHTSRVLLAATGAGLLLSGCATQDYVDQQVAAVNGRVQELSSQTDRRFQEVNGRIDAVDAKASEAKTLAEGKLLLTLVSDTDVVNFDTAKWDLSTEAQATLTAFAERLKSENKNVYIEIVGYGDVRGSVYNNRVLGEKRALEVRRFLSSHGVPLSHMETVSWGEERVTEAGSGAAANAANRRVVLRVLS